MFVNLDLSRIVEARGEATWRDVARKMRAVGMTGTHWTWVEMAERGLLAPSERVATAYAAALGVGLSEIVWRDPAVVRDLRPVAS